MKKPRQRKRKTELFSMTLTPEVKEMLVELSDHQDISMSNVIALLIRREHCEIKRTDK